MTDLESHPLANPFPLLPEAELQELAEDIRLHGLQTPITLHPDGRILDGRNRYLACKRVGVEPMFDDFGGKDALAFVLSANAHRRHLTAEQKRQIIAASIKDKPARSNRATAAATGTSDKTVAAVRAELEATAEVPQLEKTVGKDGKTRRSRKKSKAEPPDTTLDPATAKGGTASEPEPKSPDAALGPSSSEVPPADEQPPAVAPMPDGVRPMGFQDTVMTEELAARTGQSLVDDVAEHERVEPDETKADVVVPVVAANQKLPSDPKLLEFETIKVRWLDRMEQPWMAASIATQNRFVQWLTTQVGARYS